MIWRTVSAALLLRDGFTGRALTGSAATRCFLDERPLLRPIWKRDGYLVLTDIPPGKHELLICRSGYRDERISLQVPAHGPAEDTVCLKPGVGYLFPSGTVRVTISLRRGPTAASGERIWIGAQSRARLVLAQEEAKAGDSHAKLFCEGSRALLPIPGHFLMEDKNTAELVFLRSLQGENGEFAPGLTARHARGTELVAVQSYTADGAGRLQVHLHQPGRLIGCLTDRVLSADLSAGENFLEWNLEG